MTAKKSAAAGKPAEGFTDEERAAMRERVQEMKSGHANGEEEVLAKIAKMKEPDRTMARRVHRIIMEAAQGLTPRLWYGMPAYERDGKVLCYFQDAAKFKTRYSIIGFSDKANLDDASMWPTVFALKQVTQVEEAKIASLVKRAVGK